MPSSAPRSSTQFPVLRVGVVLYYQIFCGKACEAYKRRGWESDCEVDEIHFFFDKNDSLYRLPAAKNNNILKMYLLSKALGIVSNNYIMGLQKPAAEVGSFFPC